MNSKIMEIRIASYFLGVGGAGGLVQNLYKSVHSSEKSLRNTDFRKKNLATLNKYFSFEFQNYTQVKNEEEFYLKTFVSSKKIIGGVTQKIGKQLFDTWQPFSFRF